jgi:hypothetical protein
MPQLYQLQLLFLSREIVRLRVKIEGRRIWRRMRELVERLGEMPEELVISMFLGGIGDDRAYRR